MNFRKPRALAEDPSFVFSPGLHIAERSTTTFLCRLLETWCTITWCTHNSAIKTDLTLTERNVTLGSYHENFTAACLFFIRSCILSTSVSASLRQRQTSIITNEIRRVFVFRSHVSIQAEKGRVLRSDRKSSVLHYKVHNYNCRRLIKICWPNMDCYFLAFFFLRK